MKANDRSCVSRRLWSVALGLLLIGVAPASFAGTTTPVQQKQAVRKEYLVFTTGSHIPVPIEQLRGPIATTAAHEQVIRINERNRLIGANFIYTGHRF